jgi:putative oxygen-independent coproporphyrinogen III oxidase
MIANTAIPLSLYIHVPWCVRKCPYCDFNSHQVAAEGIPERQYLAALLKDLEQVLPRVWGRRVSSIFFGGGTPSLLSPGVVAELLSGIRARIPCVPTAEITLEANPGSIEAEKFKQFREAGVTRLSLGVQSFNDLNLHVLGRIHSASQAHHAITAMLESGFESFNIDLMFGLPGQDISGASKDLETALGYQPPHLSLYQLTIEPNTPFMHSPPGNLPDDDLLSDMQDELAAQAAQQGLQRYEVSAYAAQGQQCRHNLNYWEFGDYIGIGAGAHTKISDQSAVVRYSRPRLPKQYLASAGMADAYVGERMLQPQDLIIEYMINALRLRSGFSLQQFSLHTGLGRDVLSEGIAKAVALGLLQQNDDKIIATDKGFGFLSEIQLLFS